jgi:hypothetical protein
LKYHCDPQNILKTQCTQNTFTLKHFAFKVCSFEISFQIFSSSNSQDSILSDKTKARTTDTRSVKKSLFKDNSASCPACGHIITGEIGHAQGQAVGDVTLWSHF